MRQAVAAAAAQAADPGCIVALERCRALERRAHRSVLHRDASLGAVVRGFIDTCAGQTAGDRTHVAECRPYLVGSVIGEEAGFDALETFARGLGRCRRLRGRDHDCRRRRGLLGRRERLPRRGDRRNDRCVGGGQRMHAATCVDHAAHGVDDAQVAGAPTQVARQLDADALLVGVGAALHDVARRDQHARGAEAALQAMLARECGAQIGHQRVILEAFDRADLLSVALHRERDARARRLTVDQHGAGTAYPMLAAQVRAGDAALLAQEISQVRPRLDLSLDPLAVDVQCDRFHAATT